MKIRTRLTLLFTGIIAALLLLFVAAVYVSYAHDREDEYYKNLRQQAITKANLLFDAQIGPQVLQLIYKNSSGSLSQEEVAIYDTAFHLLYHDAVDIDKVKETPVMLSNIVREHELMFKQGKFQVVGFVYKHNNQEYLITAVAEDEYGLARLRNLAYILGITFLGAVILVFVAGQFFARQALKPVSDMVDRVEEITATNLDLRLQEGNGKDEIAELAVTFNAMLDRLEQSFDAQKQFVSNISHELRTPLTAMMAELEISASRERPADEYLASMQHAIADAQKLVKLSNSLLDLAKASYDPAEIKFKDLRLDEVLVEARKELLKIYPFYRIHINFEESMEDSDVITIAGNEYLLKVAFLNLMENGCKFSAIHEMQVVVTWFKDHTILRFIDTGVGISKQDLPNIFTPFYRGKNKEYADGNGIGLSLAARIVRLHKGNISVVSKENSGTTFTVEFEHV
ncbi:HAMP domain-containing sensor histidine kinase [Chitinophaga sp. Cy-1792]|uniref:sensor histidine kinase n=1 Tax=Chitinophaga sp. Cy-1792 TaxID=2608339 RepID=UPI00142391E9|nr:HAMP domain-containing sensor histidine kinase [Chitinophaga sp. Cy-1792]NIG54839.1 HAMP domain-containing histidine kinase [Chitinophaga sp. Cy-1792]